MKEVKEMKLFFRQFDPKKRAKIMEDPILQEIEAIAISAAEVPIRVFYQSLFLGGVCVILLPFSPFMFFTFKAMVFFYGIALWSALLTYKLGKDCASTITEILEAFE